MIILISGKLVNIKPSVIPNLKSNCWLPVFCPCSVYRQTRYNAKIWLDRWWRFNEVILYFEKKIQTTHNSKGHMYRKQCFIVAFSVCRNAIALFQIDYPCFFDLGTWLYSVSDLMEIWFRFWSKWWIKQLNLETGHGNIQYLIIDVS